MELKANVNLYTKPGSLKAFASLSIDEAFVIRNLTVRESESGLFVSMPSQKVGGEYKDVCFPLSKELRDEINRVVIDEYKQELVNFQNRINGQEADEKQSDGAKNKSSKSQKSTKGQTRDDIQDAEQEQDEQTEDSPVMGM